MIKTKAKQTEHNKLSVIETLIHVASFVALSFAALPFFFFTPSFSGSYGIIFRLTVITLYLLVLSALILALIGRASPLLQNTMRVIASMVGLALLYLSIGLIQDAAGVRCVGFFGADVTCASSSLLGLQMLVIFPGFFVTQALIFGTLLVVGIFQSAKARML